MDFSDSQWWWPEGLSVVPDQYADFVLDVDLPGVPKHARIALTSGTWYSLWVNGEWVSHGPLREVPPWQYYDQIDLASQLVAGRNRLRVRAYHFGHSNQSHQACAVGLMVKGMAEGAGWSVDLGNRQAWRAAASPGFLPGTARLHPCNYFGEHADLARDPAEWLLADADPAWQLPAVVGTHPLPGRERLILRDAPEFSGDVRHARKVGSQGDWQVWDFGGEVFGFLTADIETALAGTCTFLHGESLVTGLPDYQFGGGDFREVLKMPAGRRKWTSFDKRALRYLAAPVGVILHELSVKEWHWPLSEVWRDAPEAASLCERDRNLVAAAARTVTLCCDDLLNDCPRRERGQYNDPSCYMEAFPLLFGTWEPVRRWLRQYLRGADERGVLRCCYPSPSSMGIIPDFSISFAATVARYLAGSGDIETARLCFPSALAACNAFEQYSDSSGLLADVPGWTFLCNSFELARHPRSSALNALWAQTWDRLGWLAERIGESQASEYFSRSRSLRSAWREAFLRDGRVLDADSSPQHEAIAWWHYHFDADQGTGFSPAEGKSFTLLLRWSEPVRSLRIAAPGRVQVHCGEMVLADFQPDSPWFKPHPFQHQTIDLPEGCMELELHVDYSPIDWEVFVAANSGNPCDCLVSEAAPVGQSATPSRAVRLRPWFAPRFNQSTVGYAADCGMLEPEEAAALLRSCLAGEYHVPWLKRTTPLICSATDHPALLQNRVVLCNTPYSLSYFCRALGQADMAGEARELCRRLFGAMLDAGSDTLWEEFAPRSSLCHAWGAMLVPWILSSPAKEFELSDRWPLKHVSIRAGCC